jgi:hypothetical protein
MTRTFRIVETISDRAKWERVIEGNDKLSSSPFRFQIKTPDGINPTANGSNLTLSLIEWSNSSLSIQKQQSNQIIQQ